jgi:hypothetical protein
MKCFSKKPKKLSPEKQKKLNCLLMVASWTRKPTDTVKALLAAGADVHADNDWALREAAYYGYTETVRVLVQHIFAPDSWREKSRAEIEAHASALYDKLKAGNPPPEHLHQAATILADCAIDCWHQVRPPPPPGFKISPLPAQPRPM